MNGASADERTNPWRRSVVGVSRHDTPTSIAGSSTGFCPQACSPSSPAPPKKGKTWLGLGLALALATGQAAPRQYRVPEARDVLYVALEGSRVGIRARIGALARGLELDPDGDALDRLHLLYRPRPFDLADAWQATADWLRDEAARVDAALVVIDVLRAAARFKENDAEDFARVRDALDPLLDELVARSRCSTTSGSSPRRRRSARPASAWPAPARCTARSTSASYHQVGERCAPTARRSRGPRLRRARRLGVVVGDRPGEHGGFTYTDTATLALDPTAAEERDLAARDRDALRRRRLAHRLRDRRREERGHRRERDDVRATLGETPDRFASIEPKRVGRNTPTAKPWGTIAMLREGDSDPRVTRATSGRRARQRLVE